MYRCCTATWWHMDGDGSSILMVSGADTEPPGSPPSACYLLIVGPIQSRAPLPLSDILLMAQGIEHSNCYGVLWYIKGFKREGWR